jgi:hypothetical protein
MENLIAKSLAQPTEFVDLGQINLWISATRQHDGTF